MEKFETRRTFSLAIHGIVWLVYFFYDWIVRANIIEYPGYAELEFFATLVRVPLLALSTYGIIYFLSHQPYLLNNRLAMAMVAVLLITFSGLFIRVMTYLLVYCKTTGGEPTLAYAFKDLSKTIVSIVNGFFVMCVAALVHFNARFQHQARITEKLKTANKEAELSLLKSQVKPHFIFNTLNNIYSLAVQGASSTPDMIHRLANLLRFMLYNSQQKLISLKEEIAYIDSYLELEKIRYGDRLDILINEFDETSNVQIPPLILLPIIENCITHGASQETGNSWIRIDVYVKEGIHIKIENSKSKLKHVKDEKGIGLRNVLHRLKWIYGDDFSLHINDEPDSFLVDLRLHNSYSK